MYIFARKLKYRRIRSVIDFTNYTRNNLDIDVQLEDDWAPRLILILQSSTSSILVYVREFETLI